MTIETEVAALTTATTNLLTAVNVSKATLDADVATATAQASLATTNGQAQVNSAAAQVALATVQAQAAAASAASTAGVVAAAQAYASQAQATNPDAPIRLNPRSITADFTVASAYNAQSTGPITISEGITVTVQDNATWSIC